MKYLRGYRLIGAIGTLFCLVVFLHEPSFPTPDKLFVFVLLASMIFGAAKQFFIRFFPFVALLLVYESFRGIADQLNTHVNYTFSARADSWLFGNLPTVSLQNWLWHGHTNWYDYVFYFPYLLHFILPIGLALLVWQTREKYYWTVVSGFLVTAFLAFITFFIFPAAPPWLASQHHYIQPITRISSQVWAGLGLHDFPSFYQHISPNAVAAVPSLHAAWATLIVIFIYKIYGRRWALLAGVYPFLIFFGTIYEGEHFAFDVITGAAYAVIGYYLAPKAVEWTRSAYKKLMPAHLPAKFPKV